MHLWLPNLLRLVLGQSDVLTIAWAYPSDMVPPPKVIFQPNKFTLKDPLTGSEGFRADSLACQRLVSPFALLGSRALSLSLRSWVKVLTGRRHVSGAGRGQGLFGSLKSQTLIMVCGSETCKQSIYTYIHVYQLAWLSSRTFHFHSRVFSCTKRPGQGGPLRRHRGHG